MTHDGNYHFAIQMQIDDVRTWSSPNPADDGVSLLVSNLKWITSYRFTNRVGDFTDIYSGAVCSGFVSLSKKWVQEGSQGGPLNGTRIYPQDASHRFPQAQVSISFKINCMNFISSLLTFPLRSDLRRNNVDVVDVRPILRYVQSIKVNHNSLFDMNDVIARSVSIYTLD